MLGLRTVGLLVVTHVHTRLAHISSQQRGKRTSNVSTHDWTHACDTSDHRVLLHKQPSTCWRGALADSDPCDEVYVVVGDLREWFGWCVWLQTQFVDLFEKGFGERYCCHGAVSGHCRLFRGCSQRLSVLLTMISSSARTLVRGLVAL